MSATQALVLAELARHDRDAHALVQLAPPDARAALTALYGFNLEIAKIREVVREGMTGQFRLQWWRDAIEEIYTGASPRRHPTVQALAAAIEAQGWPRPAFERMMDARAFDLEDRAPRDLDELVAYAAGTAAPLFALPAWSQGAADRTTVEAAATHAGRARVLAGLLAAVPFHARQRRVYIPETVAKEAGLRVEALLDRLKPVDGLSQAVGALHKIATSEEAAARAAVRALPKAMRPCFLPLVLVRDHLQALRAAAFDPFDARVKSAQRFRYLKLSFAALFGRV
jgi:phytoene synthase